MIAMQIPPHDDAPHVLVVDDDRRLRVLLSAFLRKHGYRVTVAASAAEARAFLEGLAFEIIVLDVMMPYMDGFEVLKNLRREPETESLPVIMLTAKAQDKDVFEGYHYGADMYLTKPFNPRELVTFVQRIEKGLSGDDPEKGGPKRYDL